jgi:hypothetical protein
MKKRIDSVELSRKRGGQPGNRNAVKTERHTAEAKGERRRIRGILDGARATIREANALIAEMRGERAQGKSAP